MRLLNIGCGETRHEAWINLDLHPAEHDVAAHDAALGLPFADHSCDVAYCSHMLEHLPKSAAPALMRECGRVLRPGGILRIVVPDLETIARLYLSRLELAAQGDAHAAHEYDWIMLELFDQMVREVPGGMMREYWEQPEMPAQAFVAARVGGELDRFREKLRQERIPPRPHTRPSPEAVGAFRRGGEVHQWMYDRFSLGRLLRQAGFLHPTICTAAESAIPHFAQYHLDTLPDGRPRKPDSLYMEAVAPAATVSASMPGEQSD